MQNRVRIRAQLLVMQINFNVCSVIRSKYSAQKKQDNPAEILHTERERENTMSFPGHLMSKLKLYEDFFMLNSK